MTTGRVLHLTKLLGRLPGVGEKTAQRYVLFLLTADESLARELGRELSELRDYLRPCSRCGHLAETSPGEEPLCTICRDTRRDETLLCVVARIQDLLAIERAGLFRGKYFVLGKLLSPLEGIGPDELPLEALARRIRENGVREVIVATPPSVDGEATALFLKKELDPLGVTMTRIASGVPHGGDLEYADPITMGRALSGRQRL